MTITEETPRFVLCRNGAPLICSGRRRIRAEAAIAPFAFTRVKLGARL
jgi:hypothetical protein